MDEIVKVCKKHGDLTSDKVFFQKTITGNFSGVCKICKRERYKKMMETSEEFRLKERIRKKIYEKKIGYKHQKKWQDKNKTKINAKKREKYLINKEEINLKRRSYGLNKRRGRKCRNNITDGYVRSILKKTGLEITDELIELKRLHIKLKRKLKEGKTKNEY